MNTKQGVVITEAKWLNLNEGTKISSVVLKVIVGEKAKKNFMAEIQNQKKNSRKVK